MKESGKKINSMVMVKKNGLMDLNTRGSMLKVKRLGKGNLLGLIKATMKVISMTVLKVKGFTHGMISVNILGIGKLIKCMVRVFLLGPTVESLKGAILMIKSMGLVSFHGLMADLMRELGLMESKTE